MFFVSYLRISVFEKMHVWIKIMVMNLIIDIFSCVDNLLETFHLSFIIG